MRERFDEFDLEWSCEASPSAPATGASAMLLTWALTAREELFVADRLWEFDADARRIPDPRGVYTFVRDGELRLLFGQAPQPSNLQLRVTYPPLFSRVLAGETRRGEVTLPLPVDEYSSLARDVRSPTSIERVSRVTLIVEYRTRRSMDRDPTPPLGESAETAGLIVHGPRRVTSTLHTAPFAVKRRTGYIARVALPGEPPPGPYPLAR